MLNIIKRAVKDGLDLNPDTTIVDALQAAEDYIREYVDYDRMEQVDLTWHNDGTQFYTFEGRETWGDIVDLRSEGDEAFLRLSDMAFVKWYDIPTDKEERNGYAVVFAREFDKDGQLVLLYDRL